MAVESGRVPLFVNRMGPVGGNPGACDEAIYEGEYGWLPRIWSLV